MNLSDAIGNAEYEKAYAISLETKSISSHQPIKKGEILPNRIPYGRLLN